MKVVYLTAGAAGMYCGSCMHDNTLAKAMSREGVDIQLVPTYTPIRTDENDVSVDQVFFGGINVYLQQKIPLLRFLPRIFDRMLDSPWLIRKVTSNASNISPEELGKLTASMLKGEKGNQRKEVKRILGWLRHKANPDAIVFSNALIGGCIPAINRELKIPCYVTLQGDDIFLDSLPEKYKSICISQISQLQEGVAKFVTHSEYYADYMAEYFSIPRNKIEVTPLGIEAEDFHMAKIGGTDSERSPTIGYLARLAPEKGLDLLVDAFIQLKKENRVPGLKLKIAGWLGSNNQEFADEQFEKLKSAGLSEDFEYVGSIERDSKVDFLQTLDVLSVPTSYREPKGLFVLEAMASGVPVVQPDHGAFPEMIRETGGGLLFPAGDVGALADSLESLLGDPENRTRLAKTGYANVHTNRNSTTMAKQMMQLLSQRQGEPVSSNE